MKYFIDTNIAIGYSLKCDKWHEYANKFIQDNESQNTIIWSDTVEEEFENKFEEIFEFLKIFMNNMIELIENQEELFINYYSFEKYILKGSKNCKLDLTKKIKIIEFFWEKYNGIFDNISEMKLNIIEFNINYFSKYALRKNHLKSIITPYHCGLNNYLNYKNEVKKLKSIGIHKPDYKIVVDCNDYVKNIDSNVIFVTTDKHLYNLLIETTFLDIKEYLLYN